MSSILSGGAEAEAAPDRRASQIVPALGGRSIVLVGLMGSGKTSTGRRLAKQIGLDFVDADAEIEAAAGMSITDMFAEHGEAYFREGERRVMARLLSEGPRVIATGGGAFMNEETRANIARSAISIWLKADLDVLWRRVRKRSNRPLLQTGNPEATLKVLIERRYPIYAQADITVVSRDGPHEAAVEEAIERLIFFLRFSPDPPILQRLREASGSSGESGAPPREHACVRVELGPRSYAIRIGKGLLAGLGNHLVDLAPRAACAIVTDENVARLHLAAVERALSQHFIRYFSVIVPPGESSKSFEEYARVSNALIGAKLERGDVVIALGGGVIGDLAGFVAATLRRGTPLIQVPTTLLAQVDSSVGGKTGINSPHGKNLVGAFHQPCLVLADIDTLSTLPSREFRAGYAEVVKYGLIGDAAFFDWLQRHWRAVFEDGAERAYAIAKSCQAKAAIVAHDEHEFGDRALLNLGHTFGHALERLTGYDGSRLVHGEAVAIGMACAFRFSARQGYCSGENPAKVEAHLREVGLPARFSDIPSFQAPPAEILEAMYQDKKVKHGYLTFILARAIGDCFIGKAVEPQEILSFLRSEVSSG
ncbi:MAG TPA: 3-dehydroquinate synthase [Methylocella sp.]|nr:3-dehydroquinate synthase [Methylocella sp.]